MTKEEPTHRQTVKDRKTDRQEDRRRDAERQMKKKILSELRKGKRLRGNGG